MAKKKTTKSTSKVAKKSASKKPTKKKTAKKVAKKTVTKKTAKKKTTKKKATTKKVAKKSASKKVTKKKPVKKTTAKKPTTKTTKKKAPVVRKPAAPRPKTEEELLEEEMDKEWTVPQLKRVKTGLTKKDQEAYLQLLLEKRAEIIGNVQGMEDARNAALGDIAHMPLHMADVGSDNFEQEFTLGLMESERSMLQEIEEAIVRMREGYYGVCLDSGRPIDRARLEFVPWTKYCYDVAKLREKRGW